MKDRSVAGLDAGDFPRIVSVDDHVVEPPTMFTDRLPRRYHHVGPRVVRAGYLAPETGEAVTAQDTVIRPTDEGVPCDWWFYEDVRVPVMRANATAGFGFEQGGNTGITFDDMRPGYYDPAARLSDMDANGVEASLCFPNILPRFCGQQFLWGRDRELARLCVRAYNDWMIEEWCGDSRGRLVPLCIMPLWDAEEAAAEVRRNAARGCRAVAFSELPAALGLPSIHDRDRSWDPFLRACDETRTVVCMHIGSSSRLPYTSPDAPLSVAATLLSVNSMQSFVDWLFSGAFDRFPHLRIAYSEGNIGWIPYMLERAERTWDVHDWTLEGRRVERRPTDYYRERIFGCFISDTFGADNIAAVGVDNVTFEVDYPHADTTWPDSIAVARNELAHLSAEDVHKVVRGNAIRLFGLDHLDPAPAPDR